MVRCGRAHVRHERGRASARRGCRWSRSSDLAKDGDVAAWTVTVPDRHELDRDLAAVGPLDEGKAVQATLRGEGLP